MDISLKALTLLLKALNNASVIASIMYVHNVASIMYVHRDVKCEVNMLLANKVHTYTGSI